MERLAERNFPPRARILYSLPPQYRLSRDRHSGFLRWWAARTGIMERLAARKTRFPRRGRILYRSPHYRPSRDRHSGFLRWWAARIGIMERLAARRTRFLRRGLLLYRSLRHRMSRCRRSGIHRHWAHRIEFMESRAVRGRIPKQFCFSCEKNLQINLYLIHVLSCCKINCCYIFCTCSCFIWLLLFL